jgi:pimeloyl-ACP methyl ester carboxylesterase
MLLHGGLGNSNYWGNQVRELSANFAVIVMDTRGHGRSPVSSSGFSYTRFAEDAAGLMDFLEIPAASMIGWSDGAITGLQLAMTRPGRVSRLFAFGANSSVGGLKINGSRTPVFSSYIARCKNEYALLSPRPDRWPDLVNGLGKMWRSEPNFAKHELAAITVPTTICDGEYDEIIKREHTAEIAAGIPAARSLILRNVSHFAMLQNPAQFNRALIDFLSV